MLCIDIYIVDHVRILMNDDWNLFSRMFFPPERSYIPGGQRIRKAACRDGLVQFNRAIKPEEQPGIPATVNDQWNFLLSTIWDQMIHLVIRFDGFLDEGRLEAAVKQAVESEPLVKMRFVEAECPFFAPEDEESPIFSMIESEKSDPALRQALASPLDPATGPLATVRLIRSDHDLLILSGNHTATDGYGVKAFGSTVARLYRAGGNGYLPLKNHHDRSFDSVFRLFGADERERAWRRFGKQDMSWGIPAFSLRRGDRQYRSCIICSGTFIALKEKTARLGLTINDILLSSYIHTLTEFFPEAVGCDPSVLTSQDLRRYLSPDSYPALANLSVAFEVPFDWIPGTPLGDLALEVHATMDERKRGHAGVGAAERLCRDFSAGYQAVKHHLFLLEKETRNGTLPKRPFFSNMGVIPEGVLAFGQPGVIESFMLPPVEYPPGFGLAACTSRGALTLSSGFCGDALPPELATSFLERMGGSLTRFISG
jgi:NRPS condensation-like uncharacterized protein